MKDKYYKETRGYWHNKRPLAVGEIEKLETEVDRFAIDMKDRLKEKAKEGYTGWDDDKFQADLIKKLSNDALEARGYFVSGNYPPQKLFVDIANRAMMLARFCK